MKKWIPIFRTGTHEDGAGNVRTWTNADLDKVAEYDPARHEAPVVIGHPKNNAPAYGWVEAVKREGDILYAAFKDLIPEFREMVNKGLFKKRSMSLYPDGTLRHIGYLGAVPPAVKGLEDIAFNEGDQITIEFNDCHCRESGNPDNNNRKEEHTMPSFLEKLKSLMKSEGVDVSDLPAEKTFSEAEVKELVKQSVQTAAAEFTEAVKKKETEFSERESALKKKEDALKAEAAEGRKRAISDFCEGLKKEGKLIPAMDKLGMGITEFMNQIAGIETTIEFGEPDTDNGHGARKTQTPLEFMQSFLSALPKVIEFGEVAGREKDAGGSGNAGEKLSALTKKKLEEKKDYTYTKAFSEVQTENPELAAEYAEEIKG